MTFERIPEPGEIWLDVNDPEIEHYVIDQVTDQFDIDWIVYQAVDDNSAPTSALVDEFILGHTAPEAEWLNPVATTEWRSVFDDGTLGPPIATGVKRLPRGTVAKVQVDVVPIDETVEPVEDLNVS